MKKPFNNDKYLKLQQRKILERRANFEGRLYLEIGGKLLFDSHASRVLPGFEPDNKLKILENSKEDSEVIITIGAPLIKRGKVNLNTKKSYIDETIQLINTLRSKDIKVENLVITQLSEDEIQNQDLLEKIQESLKNSNTQITLKKNYYIQGYPNDLAKVLSTEGLLKNEYIDVDKDIVVVIAAGPGSGKLNTCLSQIYHETKKGQKSGYAKLELFPVWSLSPAHEVNLAYEAATMDLGDKVTIDTYYKESKNAIASTYNRDLEAFEIVKTILYEMTGQEVYSSPTEMGINYAGFCIEDEIEVKKAAIKEICHRLKEEPNNFERKEEIKKQLEKKVIELKAKIKQQKAKEETQQKEEKEQKEKTKEIKKDNKILEDGQIIEIEKIYNKDIKNDVINNTKKINNLESINDRTK